MPETMHRFHLRPFNELSLYTRASLPLAGLPFPVFPLRVLRIRYDANLHLCIQVHLARRVCLGDLLKVYKVLESVYDCRILG